MVVWFLFWALEGSVVWQIRNDEFSDFVSYLGQVKVTAKGARSAAFKRLSLTPLSMQRKTISG